MRKFYVQSRNYIQERPTQMYANGVLYSWKESKQTQCPTEVEGKGLKLLFLYCSPTKNKLIYQVRVNFWLSGQNGIRYILIPPDDALPLNSLFWSPPTAVHGFEASDMAVSVYIFLVYNVYTWFSIVSNVFHAFFNLRGILLWTILVSQIK